MSGYLKFLNCNLHSPYRNFDYTDYVRTGDWLPPTSNPRLCEHGYHVCTPSQAHYWIDDRVFQVDVRTAHNHGVKVTTESFRFIRELEIDWHDLVMRMAIKKYGGPV